MDDREQRHRAIEETDRSFVVEASAGTGKTRILIRRILHLVLERGPSGPPLPLSEVCAITFTEKAAGEMRLRLRQEFEQAASRSPRAREALGELEAASISTFHSLAVSLLKERPIEAGLDPHFTPLDEIRRELFFRDVWDGWIRRALAERDPVLERALRNRLSLDNIRDLARTMSFNSHAVKSLSRDAPPTPGEMADRTRALGGQGTRFWEMVRNPEDKLASLLADALAWLRNPSSGCPGPAKPGNTGSADNWTGGKKMVLAVREYVREVAGCCEFSRRLPLQNLFDEVLCWIQDRFLGEWESRKRAAGFLDFDDQLWMMRDLLMRSRAVRREFQSRYGALLVDEFQDTDLVQWHIVLLLSSDDPEATELARLRPRRGKLFLVGDPKQSIYRFRNADIETYLGIVEPRSLEALGMERLELTTNYRSVPSILRFVDAAFAPVMGKPADGFYQPDYLPFGGVGDRTEEQHPPSVHLLLPSESHKTVREFLELEASTIAGMVARIRGSESWKVQDPTGWHKPRYRDIAILLPVLSRSYVLEDELRRLEIPYVLEGGRFYYTRSEVSSAVTALRAIANPNDTIALYGSLRSLFFGFSDEDLLRFTRGGGILDYRKEAGDPGLAHAFGILADLHRQRHLRRASETLETLLEKTGAREILSVRGMQSVANLNKLVRTLRSLQGDLTFPQIVELVGTIGEDGLAEGESRLMEERSDAVRVLSIHRSKGLDFPIVFVAGLGMKKLVGQKDLIADFHRKKIYGLRVGPRDTGQQTPQWEELSAQERKRESAETARLLYVALTRARDHLVLSTHAKEVETADGAVLARTEGTRLEHLKHILARSADESLFRLPRPDAAVPADAGPRQSEFFRDEEWVEAFERESAELRDLVRFAPAEEGPASGEPPSRESSRGRAIRLGVAFHAAMEQADLFESGGWSRHARDISAQHGLDRQAEQELLRMIRASLSSELLERVRQAVRSGGRVLREVPFVRASGDGMPEEGKIDLLFEEPDGWVLVDYKTDQEEAVREGYAGQIGRYREALAALSVNLKEAYLLLARSGTAVGMA